jgi:hypothetical protein
MHDNYDFSNSKPNPYAEKLKKPKIAKLKSFKGKINLNLNIDLLRKRNTPLDSIYTPNTKK